MDKIRILVMAVIAAGFSGVSASLATEEVAPLYQIISPVQEHAKGDTDVLRSAAVALGPELFALQGKSRGSQLRFATFSGDVSGEITWTRESGLDGFSVAGPLSGGDQGHFCVTVHAGAAAVSVHDEKRGWLRVSQTAEGPVLEEIDQTARPECGACVLPQAPGIVPDSIAGTLPKADKEDPVNIDVLVVYTPASRLRAGSAAAIESLILNSADLANVSYANSNIPLTISVVNMAEVNYTEDYSLALALAKLTFDNDGVMDEVHALRNTYNADMVSLVASGGDVAGIGWILTSLDSAMAQRAFSITTYYSLGSLTFAHELGHNMGCDHDQQNITADGYRLFSYARGWRFYAAGDGLLKRTVMSYAPGTRIPHFSNPDVLYLGTPTGVAVGDSDEAHCALAITQSAPYLAQNRPLSAEGEGEVEGEPPVVYEGYYCEKMGALYTNTLLRSLLPPFAVALFDLLNPETADLNGGTDPETLSFSGNGMLDCAYELGVLRKVQDTPTLDLSSTGGVTYAEASAAYANNSQQLVADIGTNNAFLVNGIAPGLLDMAAAYITLGDEGSAGFIAGLLDIINEVQYVGTLNLAAYTRLPQFLAAEGDADGDGFTNRQEYEAYYSYGPDAYVSFALNPSVFPNGTGSGEVTILGRPRVKEGEEVVLQALLSYMVGEVTISWYKDGEAISGATSAEYRIGSVVPDDAGEYRVLVTDQSKGLYESPPFVLEVVSAESMPVSGLAAVSALALVLSWVGIRRFRPFRIQRPEA